MSDDFEQQSWVKFGVASALAKQYAADQRGFLEMLSHMLASALPDATETVRRGGLFAKKTIQRIVVTIGENRYTLEDSGRGPLTASRTHIVRGIALKTEEISVELWVEELGAQLDERARTSLSAREALSKLVG